VVAVGSHGALQAAQTVLGFLPVGFPAPIVLDLHRAGGLQSTESMLRRRAALAVLPATDGVLVEKGIVYLSPYDSQLVLTSDGFMGVAKRRNGVLWTAGVDVLLVSAAQAFGPRLVVVVLSGRLDGGALGVREVKRRGGRVLAQDPVTAVAPSMPSAALATGCVDFALSPESLGPALVALCASPGAAELFRVRLNPGVRG